MLREITSPQLKLKEKEKAYFVRFAEFDKRVFEIIIVNSDPTIAIKIDSIDEFEFVEENYKELYEELVSKTKEFFLNKN